MYENFDKMLCICHRIFVIYVNIPSEFRFLLNDRLFVPIFTCAKLYLYAI